VQRLGQLILCLSLLLAGVLGYFPNAGPAPVLQISPAGSPAGAAPGLSIFPPSTAPVVPLALVLVFGTVIMLCTRRGSGRGR
jgi:hypothetical protein